jgi:replicative DNA helicase
MSSVVRAVDDPSRGADSYLLERGFSAEAIAGARWRVAPLTPQQCQKYGLPSAAAGAGAWVIPYRHANGNVAFERLRLIEDADLTRFGGGKYRQPAGRSLALYDPYGVLQTDGVDFVLLIEGEANAVAVHMTQPALPVIGIPGQTGLTEPMAKELGHIQSVALWIDRHDKGSERNAARIAQRLREAGVEEVRQLETTAGLDANDALRELGPDTFGEALTTMIDRAEISATIVHGDEDWPIEMGQQGPPFPLEALGDKLAEFVRAISVETQTPPDLAALAALAVLSAAALGSAVVDCGTWEEELSLYIMVAMPSGDRKSAVLRSVIAPLRQLERETRDESSERVRSQRSRRKTLQAREQRTVRKIGEVDAIEERVILENELEEIAADLERLGEPVTPRLLADDATPEALGGLLAVHPRLAILAAEAPILDNVMGRYSDSAGAANLHLICKAYTGEEARVDRRGRDPEQLDRPLLTILLATQPHVLQRLIEHPTARAQGLVGRFAYSVPESRLGNRLIDPPGVPPQLHSSWSRIVRNVYSTGALTKPTKPENSVASEDHGVVTELTKPGSVSSVSVALRGVLSISLSPSASARLSTLRAEQEPRLAKEMELRPIADWISRHAGRAARIAALLHLIDHSPETPISDDTMRRALLIAEYLLGHSVAALSTPDELTRNAVATGADVVSQRQLHRGPLGSRGTAERAARLAHALVELGALRPNPRGEERAPNHPGGPSYAVNPNLRMSA